MISDFCCWGWVVGILTVLLMGYWGVPVWCWGFAVVGGLLWAGTPPWLVWSVGAVFLVLIVPAVRRVVFSANVMRILNALKLLPVISETEKVALEAGSIWVDGELFSGSPNLKRLMSEPYGKLSLEEQSFVDNQCETVCRLVDDQKAYEDGDLSTEVWKYLRQERFLGLIIPKEYGGHAFSAIAHSEIVSKLSTASIPLAISVMVPNSLGPAELLIHYGTDEQKNYYLPRLAKGIDIPCFGLTEPGAGSDAGAMQSEAEVFRGDDGKLYLRMNWRKRYITLGAVATVLGLAVKLKDPKNLLGKGSHPGITCVLVPHDVKGVVLGKRHDPLGVPFFNCPIEGHDVVVSVEQIIGGVEGAGQGWKMLMECLAAGRAISLPAQSVGGAKYITRVAGAYAQVRQQFGISIGKFEGIDEALARIGGLTYMLEGARIYTVGAVDSGLKPAVISAIAKLNATEITRQLVNQAMDICGGAGISQGPRNLLAKGYIAAPIAITVEGANILTRTMIIFGQGAIRCHPFAYKEIAAMESGDLVGFDQAFTGHVGHIVKNLCRSIVLSLTRGRMASVPGAGFVGRYQQKLAWASASFAILSDIAMGSLGGKLKFREKTTGRFADILSWMYLITATLRRFEAEGRRKDHEIFVRYAASYGFVRIQEAFDGIFSNLDVPVLGPVCKYLVGFWSRLNPFDILPSDAVGSQIARVIMEPGELRDSLTKRAIYIPKDETLGLGRLENAFVYSVGAHKIAGKIARAMRDHKIPHGKPMDYVEEALKAGVIEAREAEYLKKAKAICDEAIDVDAFNLADYKRGVVNASKPDAFV